MEVNEEKKNIKIYSPLDGEIIPIEEVPDETFALKMIGDGVGIVPSGRSIYAPCDIDFIDIFERKNAFIFKENQDLEFLVYFGVETVKLEGKGFEKVVEKGDRVRKGEAVIDFDLEFIKNNAKSHISSVIVSTMEKVEKIEKAEGRIKAGDLLMTVYLKQ